MGERVVILNMCREWGYEMYDNTFWSNIPKNRFLSVFHDRLWFGKNGKLKVALYNNFDPHSSVGL